MGRPRICVLSVTAVNSRVDSGVVASVDSGVVTRVTAGFAVLVVLSVASIDSGIVKCIRTGIARARSSRTTRRKQHPGQNQDWFSQLA